MSYEAHYSIRKVTIRGKEREILQPSNWLKAKQRALIPLLEKLPISQRAHAYVEHRNIYTCLEEHNGNSQLGCCDIKAFFGSCRGDSVYFMLRHFGYSASEASNAVSLVTYHNRLPFGACTSPILSNLIFRPIDDLIELEAQRYGCFYSRYSDDILISHPHLLAATLTCVSEVQFILERFNFTPNFQKTRFNPARLFGVPLTYPLSVTSTKDYSAPARVR